MKHTNRDEVNDGQDSVPVEPEVTLESEAAQAGQDALKKERDDLFQRLARVTADFQNSRRRLEQEKDQAIAYANSALIKSLLPIIDAFERALATDPSKSDGAAVLKGMQIVHDQLMTVLSSQYVETITAKPGEPFDPTRMEAIMQQSNDKLPPNSVTQLLQTGYALHGRTLRPAQVFVNKGE